MIIDMHIHTKDCSDGNLYLEDILKEAGERGIGLMAITDHDNIGCQKKAAALAQEKGIRYVPGVELNVGFHHDDYNNGKSISLDLLGYNYDVNYQPLRDKIKEIADFRVKRAKKILDKLNIEFQAEGLPLFTDDDLKAIEVTVDGVFGRPHIANYMIEKGIVTDKQEAFDRYLVKCDVPKFPFPLWEAAPLVRAAGGIAILAHPNDPNGTSLVKLTSSLEEQSRIIEESVLEHIDGIECFHSRNDVLTTEHYVALAKKHSLIITGGSDCHQKPILLGSVDIPDWVAEQF
jgi:predicted metal-dependent phosphoesterase TrpH